MAAPSCARAAATAAVLLGAALVASCVRQLPAPMQDRSTTEGAHWETYTVREDDTLYSIAWRHELDYKALAEANGIEPPYIIRPGQRLALVGGQLRGAQPAPEQPAPAAPPTAAAPPEAAAQTGPREVAAPAWQTLPAVATAASDAAQVGAGLAKAATDRPAPKPAAPAPQPRSKPPATVPSKPSAPPAKATPPTPNPAADAPRAAAPPSAPRAAPPAPKPQAPARKASAAPGWRQPVARAPARGFGGASKGYDYDLPPATQVFAVHDGEVAYAGPGIGGFRHTFIVKVGDKYLVAYSLNAEPRLKEGDTISAGDVVASIGSGGAGAGRLHFEIRERGRAVDPAPLIGR